MSISKFTKTNLIFSFIVFTIALIYPYFVDNIIYSNKSAEAVSISKMVEKVQNLRYINTNKYINSSKGDTQSFSKSFNISVNDMKFYDYSVFTTFDSYTLYAEPKIQYLKARDISPEKFVFYKKLNKQAIAKWQ